MKGGSMSKYFILLCCFFLGCSTMTKNHMRTPSNARAVEQWVEKTLAKMTLREKLGQMFFYHLDTNFKTEDDPAWQKITMLVKTYNLGGVHLWRGEPYATAY